MSQTVITLAFEQWKAQQGNTGEVVLLDEFVFANVPGLDPAKPIDRNEKLPPAGQIVHRQAVTRKGVVNENAVVHSVVLGADVGDFSFNWIGLINKASGTLAMIVHAPVQQKLKTKEGQQGNVLTRSFLMEYNGAQAETAINTPAETWQIDFTARMAGMDERQRLENTDIYGAAAFFGDGRPGVEMNGERITRVHLENDTMAVTWTPRNKATGEPLQKTPLQRQIESQYPELAAGLHLPKFARVLAPTEEVSSGNFADPFRPRYAVNVQLLDAEGNPDKQTPVYSAVPLPVPMAGNDAGMYQFPPEGTLVEVGFTGGRPDKPFIRQTVPEGNSLPDIKPGEQLQQQRAEVSQRVTQAGDWVRQTDQAIDESSMTRVIKADTERRELVSRDTTIKATDNTRVLGTATLMAGAIQQVSAGDYSQAVKGNWLASVSGNAESKIAGNHTVHAGGDLTEQIGKIRKSVAAIQQQIIAPVVWIGSGSINVAQLMLDTLDVLKELAEQTASHTHSNTGAPTNAGAIRGAGQKADQLNGKYSPVIGQ
ncbi:phage tail-collar fiber domain-containing protein [Klebsiella aerogenes]|uniref:phage tail-collar fiber domain-containing protein n=1 Tax=Klebsiella aerogenes TaxID=548 RepID=UPI003753CAD3